MKLTREFAPVDRYRYDFGLCSTANGWAQIDTAQDASYFGTWANPTKLIIFSYCEGDTTDDVPVRGVAGGGPRALVRAELVSRAARQAG